jgi:hypothetical protein
LYGILVIVKVNGILQVIRDSSAIAGPPAAIFRRAFFPAPGP